MLAEIIRKWNFRSYDEIKTILQNPTEDSKKIKQSEEGLQVGVTVFRLV